MANCCNCSAPLPPNTIRCEYCGSRNDIDLVGINYYTTHELDTARICPRCSIPLQTINLKTNDKFLIERCDRCLGLFFDPGELEALLEASVSNVFSVNRSQIDNINNLSRSNDYSAIYVKCPICSKIMNRVNFGTRSGVIVDRCKDHGVWLDGGELRHLLEWMKAGGQLLDQQRRAEREKEDAAREGKEQAALGANHLDRAVFNNYGSTLKRNDPDLFDMVRGAIDFFLR